MAGLFQSLAELFHFFVDLILHLDQHLHTWVTTMGQSFYVLVFLVIFAESGIFLLPMLPGDSFLFALGALVASETLNGPLLVNLLLIAAIGGGVINYELGRWIGSWIIERGWIKRKHLDKTHAFYEKHGGKTILLARFIPIVRTFAPFVAGMSKMSRTSFHLYNSVGGGVWILSLIGLGYYFGNMPVVKRNFGILVPAIIVISVLPIIWELVQARRRS